MASRLPEYVYKAKVVNVVDGRTADFLVDLGFHLSVQIRGSFLGFDTPERGQPGFRECTAALEQLLNWLRDTTFGGLGNVLVRTHKTGKYGRWLVEVLVPEGHDPLAQQMRETIEQWRHLRVALESQWRPTDDDG